MALRKNLLSFIVMDYCHIELNQFVTLSFLITSVNNTFLFITHVWMFIFLYPKVFYSFCKEIPQYSYQKRLYLLLILFISFAFYRLFMVLQIRLHLWPFGLCVKRDHLVSHRKDDSWWQQMFARRPLSGMHSDCMQPEDVSWWHQMFARR